MGEMVGLRKIEQDDLPYLLQWRNQPDLRKYFREYRELNLEHQRNWFHASVTNDKSTEMFSIVSLDQGELLGACGLCYIRWTDRNADFSIYIGKDSLYIDEIYAVDAARVLLRYGFEELNLHRVWAEIYDIDDRKKKLLEKLGFSLEGIQKEAHWTEGAWHDSLFYGMLNPDKGR